MIRVFVADPDLLMGHRVVAAVKTGDRQGLIPMSEIEIWRPAQGDREIRFVRKARVLLSEPMRLCDVPEWALEMHYDPEQRTHQGVLDSFLDRSSRTASKMKGRSHVTLLFLYLP